MKEERRQQILDGAVRVLARKRYQYTTIADIAREAGVSKGLVHVYFENKLDVLLSVILLFARTVNERNRARMAGLTDPLERLQAVFGTFQELMAQDSDTLYWGHMLREGLPAVDTVKSQAIQEKYSAIAKENRDLVATIDGIIADGQQQGCIDPRLKPALIRQILGGASQMLYNGLSLQQHRARQSGYTEPDVHTAMQVLIEKFRFTGC